MRIHNKFTPVLLIGFLSILFAEVFAGSSHLWFFSTWGLFIVWPLYMLQVVLLLTIALKVERISLRQLYLFGILLGLYESWVTKVIWAGYTAATGPGIGTFLGMAIPEFPVLVFFWHPIMSFMLPILSFEILTGKVPQSHEKILTRKPWKTVLIILFFVCIGTFIARNNGFNFLVENVAILGTLLLIFLAYLFSRKTDLDSFKLPAWGIVIAAVYLAVLYIGSFIFISPERIPHTILPYITVLAFYAIAILFISMSKRSGTKLVELKEHHYSWKHLLIFALVLIASTNFFSLFQGVADVVFRASYYILILAGISMFFCALFVSIREKIKPKKESAY